MSSPLILKIVLYIVIIMVFAFIINITISILLPVLKLMIKNAFSIFKKEKTINATIIAKRVYSFDNNNNDFLNNYLTFQTKNGETFELLVDNYYYNFYSEGEKGLLTYKGAIFIDFIRSN